MIPYLHCVILLCFAFPLLYVLLFFFNDTATTEIYTLSLHDALPISCASRCTACTAINPGPSSPARCSRSSGDRKSTRLNSSHLGISYAVFCLKKKKVQLDKS